MAHRATEVTGDGSTGSRGRRLLIAARIGVAFMAMVATLVLISNGSRAAFNATTENAGNNWAAGTVTISDDDGTAAMFDATGMAPGETVVNCIEVTYEGSLTPANVRLYGTAGGGGLATFLDLTVEIGTGGGFGDCTGFSAGSTLYDGTLSGFAAAHTNFADGAAGWSPAAPNESRTYRFSLTVQDDNGAQGLDATGTFTWEAQNQ